MGLFLYTRHTVDCEHREDTWSWERAESEVPQNLEGPAQTWDCCGGRGDFKDVEYLLQGRILNVSHLSERSLRKAPFKCL